MSDAYHLAATSQNQAIAVVVKFNFTTPVYVTTHSITGLTGTVFTGALSPKGAISQRLNPDDSRSEIGAISFSVLDTGITGELKTRLDSGEGLKRTEIEVWRGGQSDNFADFKKVQTQIIENQVTVGNGRYNFSCSDIQRSMKKEIFEPATTSITATFSTSATTLSVVDTTDFEPCPHTTSFSDAPSASMYYLKLKKGDDFEIISATGKTATTFTGITRGLFHTDPFEFVYDAAETAENQVQVTEYVYLELPVPAMAYALLTGQIINGGTLPSKWHLGIDPSWVDVDQFQNVGVDWFDPNDYSKGLIYRFDGIEKTEGKRFIEQELLRLIAFMPIGGDGKLGFKRISRIIENSDYRYILDPSNVIKHSDLKYNLSKTTNVVDLRWGYVDVPNQTKGFTRQTILYDAPSVTTHKGEYWKTLNMRGLHNARHTKTVIRNLFHAYRDRYSNPPFEISLDLLPTVYDLQVGDTVKVQLPNIKDPVTDAALDRTFEVQRVSTDLVSGKVKVDLFASSGEASIITDDDAADPSELPDGWYPTQGTNATTPLSIDVNGFLTADGTLTGGASARTWYYYLGDFTIPSGRTLTIDKNVGFAVRGHLQIDGTILTQGGGSTKFLGSTEGGGPYRANGPQHGVGRGTRVAGQNETLPAFTIDNDAGVLTGIPEDTAGTNGPNGQICFEWNDIDAIYDPVVGSNGGAGGLGGGGAVFVSRGAGLGVAGEINVSGANGSLGSISSTFQGGSGGGGAPGSALFLIDGNTNPYPILNGKVTAEFGISPSPSASLSGGRGKATSTIDLGVNNTRVMYVPASRDPYPDYGVGDNATTGGSTTSHYFEKATEPTDTDAQNEVSRNLLKGDQWGNTSNNTEHHYTGSSWQPKTASPVWGVNIGNQPPDSAVLNANQLWNEISGTGKPADNATVGADWATNLNGRPTELTDGRVAAGLAANGDVARTVPVTYIPNLAADKLIAGTIGAYSIYLGNTKFHLDGTNRRMDIFDNAGTRRVRIGYDGADYGIEIYNGSGTKLFDADGNALLAATSQVEDGVNYRNIARGLERGACRDGDNINFPLAWDSPPAVDILGGGLSYSDSLSGPQFQDFKAINVSATGFTVSAKLKELASGVVNHTDTGSTTAGTLDHEMHKSQSAEAHDDAYTFQYDVTITNQWDAESGFYNPGSVTVGIYTNDGTNWVQRATKNHAGGVATGTTTRPNETHTITVDGLTNHGGREFAIHIESTTYGASLVFDSVKYATAIAPATTSATPTGTPDLFYHVLGGQ